MTATYDVFISHNRADKAWAHALADRLSEERWNYRTLRPWLDEQVLDPGDIDESELTTALDRTRHLVVALSPESVASRWVQFEASYFVEQDPDCSRVTTVDLRPNDGIAKLANATRVEWSDGSPATGFLDIVRRVCPKRFSSLHPFREVEDAFKRAAMRASSMRPTPEGDRLRDALFAFDIDDPAFEGLAVQAFVQAGELLEQFHENWPEHRYAATLLLGDCLANALVRSSAYRHVVQLYIDQGSQALSATVARALSRLADIEPGRIEPTLVLGLVAQLDARETASEATIGLLCHALGKGREVPLVMMLLKLLGEAGPVARRLAALSIGLSHLSEEVALISEDVSRTGEMRVGVPSFLLYGELTAIGRGQPDAVQQAVAIARQELRHAYPQLDIASWRMNWRFETMAAPTLIERGPLLGIVARATVANMAEVAARIDERHAVYLTEGRVVDALFDRAGALIIPEQSSDTHLCRRLRSRGVTFAMLAREADSLLADDDYLFADTEQVVLWQAPVRQRRLIDQFP
ncbi:MAG: toll/interleukin-1 receptor domain-containing protein [Polyangiaceae bacterium]